MERKYIVSAFLDLHGFGSWIYRASIPREVKEPFIESYLGIVQDYVKAHKNLTFKYLGDGFLSIREFDPAERKSGAITDFVRGLRCVTRKIMTLIKRCPQPPVGVRVRISDGYAYKAMVIDSIDHHLLIPEYIEYGVNTAEKLLGVNPEIVCVVTEDVAKALEGHRSIFRMRKLGRPSCYPTCINKEDLETLWIVKF